MGNLRQVILALSLAMVLVTGFVVPASAQVPPKDPTLTLPDISSESSSFAFGDPSETHSEIGDAGDLPANAQSTGGSGPLTSITGSLSGVDDVDMYSICITDPALFVAATNAFGGAGAFDTMLHLFTQSGGGVSFNDDHSSSLLSQLNSIPSFAPSTPGIYNLAITSFFNIPQDSGSLAADMLGILFEDEQTDLIGTVDVWLGFGSSSGTYTIALLGVEFCDLAIGGTILPIDTTALLVAGAQTMTPWLILGVITAVGIGLAVFTLKRSR